MANHTPLPWAFSPWHIEEGSPALRAPAGWIVCTTASDDDAKFIAQSVNNHDALVAALKNCQRVLAMMVDPASIKSTTSMHAWTEAVAAETGARIALSHIPREHDASRLPSDQLGGGK